MHNKENYKNYILSYITNQYDKIKFISNTNLIKNNKKMFLVNMYFKNINTARKFLDVGI